MIVEMIFAFFLPCEMLTWKFDAKTFSINYQTVVVLTLSVSSHIDLDSFLKQYAQPFSSIGPNFFGPIKFFLTDPIRFGRSKTFLIGPKCFGPVFMLIFYRSKMLCTRPKCLDQPKRIGSVQNKLNRPKEGKVISAMCSITFRN